jgi:hypothetical protein
MQRECGRSSNRRRPVPSHRARSFTRAAFAPQHTTAAFFAATMAASIKDIVRNPYGLVQAVFEESVAADGLDGLVARGGAAPPGWTHTVTERLAAALTEADLAEVSKCAMMPTRARGAHPAEQPLSRNPTRRHPFPNPSLCPRFDTRADPCPVRCGCQERRHPPQHARAVCWHGAGHFRPGHVRSDAGGARC